MIWKKLCIYRGQNGGQPLEPELSGHHHRLGLISLLVQGTNMIENMYLPWAERRTVFGAGAE